VKKTILITGCSSGIGRASVGCFAKNGWNVVATMRKPARDPDLVGLDGVLITRLDVQDRDSIGEAITAGITRFGQRTTSTSCVRTSGSSPGREDDPP